MTRSGWWLVLVVGALLFSCGTETLRKGDLTTAFARGGSVTLQLHADRAAYALGEPVELTLAVTNPGPAPISLTAPSSQLYDFTVLKEAAEVWRWSADRMFLTVLTPLTIPPGETIAFTESWDQRDRDGRPANPGDYVIVGTLIGGEQVGLTPRHLRITIR